MPVNLSLLSVEEKNKIEIDKQASYLVWQLKQAKIGPNEMLIQREKLKNEDEKTCFEQSVAKYKRAMGVV
ncbi:MULTISPECIES: DUF3283 family protein [unclassified Vibrio]|uniref:DUF3283 family protein n=1 Tax=unclassified Vibrio TaxID=2614977 RepID=UPI00189D11C3|nr:DUF3283 family protein [Vibrio sp. VB16]UGA56514.1 DUF3283 family protein [Vibrio sp. VB16]